MSRHIRTGRKVIIRSLIVSASVMVIFINHQDVQGACVALTKAAADRAAEESLTTGIGPTSTPTSTKKALRSLPALKDSAQWPIAEPLKAGAADALPAPEQNLLPLHLIRRNLNMAKVIRGLTGPANKPALALAPADAPGARFLRDAILQLEGGGLVDSRSDLKAQMPVSVSCGSLTPNWWRWGLVTLAGLLLGWAVMVFERYRSARVQELNAALSESEELTQQLTVQKTELGKVNRVLALDYAVTRAIAESATPVEAALWVLQIICVATGWDVGAIWDVDPQSDVARCVGVWQKSMTDAVAFEALNQGDLFLPGTGLPGRVLASRQPHWVTDISQCGSLPRLTATAKENLRSGFGFPILVGSEVIGILELYSCEVRQKEQDLVQIMSFVGGHIGQLLQRKRIEDALIRSKEERLLELQRVRKRIATDFHDDVGASLTKIALLSEAVRQKVAEENLDAAENLSTITTISNELVESMSDIVWAINPQKDSLSDLAQRMRRFASDIFTTCQIAFCFRAPGVKQDMQMGANLRREVFLIFKESVNNVVKHAQCTEVVLDLAIEGGWLNFSISDNGKGFNPSLVKADTGFLTSQHKGGNGLASMRRRARELGGHFEMITSIGRGTTMTLRLPTAQAVRVGE